MSLKKDIMCSPSQSLKNKGKHLSMAGRSMLEILGVLAIIGVLSIGGLSAYTMAMSKVKANRALNDASLIYADAVHRRTDLSNWTLIPLQQESGLVFRAKSVDEDGIRVIYVKAENVSESVCNQLIKMKTRDLTFYDDASQEIENCSPNGSNMVFAFETSIAPDDLGGEEEKEEEKVETCSPACDAERCMMCSDGECVSKCQPGDVCVDGVCKDDLKECKEGELYRNDGGRDLCTCKLEDAFVITEN